MDMIRDRRELRYQNDLTDEKWALAEPLVHDALYMRCRGLASREGARPPPATSTGLPKARNRCTSGCGSTLLSESSDNPNRESPTGLPGAQHCSDRRQRTEFRKVSMLQVHHSSNRWDLYKGAGPLKWDTDLKCWCVFDPKMIADISRRTEFHVVNYPHAVQTIIDRIGMDYLLHGPY